MITWLVILSIWVLLMTAAVVGLLFRANELHDTALAQGIAVLELRQQVEALKQATS